MEQLRCKKKVWQELIRGGEEDYGGTSFKMKALNKILILKFIFPFCKQELHCTWAHGS